MEWVETTGKTLEEAKEAALDQLGVAPEDAEFDVVEEPRSGLFGRVRQEARVRARVRPTSPRPKAERRDRRRKGADEEPAAPARSRGGRRGAADPADAGASDADASDAGDDDDATTAAPARRRGGRRAAEAVDAPSSPGRGRRRAAPDQEAAPTDDEGADEAAGAAPAPARGRRRAAAPPTSAAAAGAVTDGGTGDEADEPGAGAPPPRGRGRRPARASSGSAEVDAAAEDLAADVVGEGAVAPPNGNGRGGRRRSPSRAPQAAAEQDGGVADDDADEVVATVAAAGGRGADVADEPTLTEQADTVRDFLEGLVDAFGADEATVVEVDEVDEETIEARVVGDDLGLLIGPKGATLQAVQEIARTVVQRAAEPGRGARLRVDIGGYREQRREALGRFTRQLADQVLSSGEAVALEPMSAPDRKVVHDTVNEIDGVTSSSDGEDPDRRVVISPA